MHVYHPEELVEYPIGEPVNYREDQTYYTEWRLNELARDRGIRRMDYFLDTTEIAPSTANRLWRPDLQRIDLKVLTQLCAKLRVQPAALIAIVDQNGIVPYESQPRTTLDEHRRTGH